MTTNESPQSAPAAPDGSAFSTRAASSGSPRPAGEGSAAKSDAPIGVNGHAQRKILVVEDDPTARASILLALRREGFLCTEAASSERARFVIGEHRPDLIILDLGLPDGDGLELLKELRRNDDLPVVVCSGRDAERDRLAGFDQGADDYVTKPFSAKELAYRVRSVLKRRSGTRRLDVGTLRFGPVEVIVDVRQVRVDDREIELTAREFDLLLHLVSNPKVTFSRSQLLSDVWPDNGSNRSEATVTEHMRRLRQKLGDDTTPARFLCSVRGVGYRFVP